MKKIHIIPSSNSPTQANNNENMDDIIDGLNATFDVINGINHDILRSK